MEYLIGGLLVIVAYLAGFTFGVSIGAEKAIKRIADRGLINWAEYERQTERR